MFGIGLPELAIILVIVLIVFGAGKLPAIGAGLGKSIRNFKNAVREVDKIAEKQELQ
jgi:sec-independent protein translocase protein TatA